MNTRLRNGLICIFVLIGIAVLYWFNPEDYMWMPKCPTKLLFNIDCPGCGFQRAIHAILHGEFKRAFALNPFLFLAAPYAIIAFSYENIEFTSDPRGRYIFMIIVLILLNENILMHLYHVVEYLVI